jgi:hypothetical protein
VLNGRAGDAELEGDDAGVVGGQQFFDWVPAELRHVGRKIERGEVEGGASAVDSDIVVVTVEGHGATQTADRAAVAGGESPGSALFGGEGAPEGRDAAPVAAYLLLTGGLGIGDGNVLTFDLAVAGDDVDDVAELAGLWDVEFLAHIGCRARPGGLVSMRAPIAGGSSPDTASLMADESMERRRRATLLCGLVGAGQRRKRSDGASGEGGCFCASRRVFGGVGLNLDRVSLS